MIDSHEKPWFSKHANNYHIQSHFIIFNRKAINLLTAFYDSIDMKSIFEEENIANIRKTVINNWEIELSQFLITKGLKLGFA